MDRIQQSRLGFFISGLLLFGLPGCGRMVDWGKRTFYQGEQQEANLTAAHKHVRSIVAYDQLETAAQFDALWLSPEVRNLYAYLYTRISGKGEEQKKTLERRQMDENNHFIIFYVLSSYKIPLGTPESLWHIFLEIDGYRYAPIEIKPVELVPLYKEFFGKKYSIFKTAYQLKFDARDVDDEMIIRPDSSCVVLYFRSLRKEVSLSWNIPVTMCNTDVNCAPKNHGTPLQPEPDKCLCEGAV